MKKVLLSLVLIVVLMLTACGYSPVEDRERDLYSLFGTAASAEELIEFSNIEIQQRLIDLGFLEGSADNIIGPKTIEAITRFQEMVGLEPTGKFDDTTLITLFSDNITYVPRAEINLGDHDYLGETTVFDIQNRLFLLNYLTGSATGVYAEKTADAMSRFAVNNGFEASTTATREVIDVLFSDSALASPQTSDESAYELFRALGFASKPYKKADAEDVRAAFIAFNEYVNSLDGFVIDFLPDIAGDDLPECITGSNTYYTALSLISSPFKYANISATRIQSRLYMLNYCWDDAFITGKMDEDTQTALSGFQTVNGLPVTGKVDDATLDRLFSLDAIAADKNDHRYRIEVDCANQRTYAYEWLGNDYNKLVKTFICSTGADETETRKGTFKSEGPIEEWHEMHLFGTSWAKWAFRINGRLLFHSVLFYGPDESRINKKTVDDLGSPVSHGCVRLAVEDAKWIYENNTVGTIVVIY